MGSVETDRDGLIDLTHRSSDGTLMEPRGVLFGQCSLQHERFFKFCCNRMDGETAQGVYSDAICSRLTVLRSGANDALNEDWPQRLPPPDLILWPSQQVRQLGDVDGDPPRLVLGQSAHSHAPAGFVFVINIRERLSFGVADAERLGGFVDLPGRGKCHSGIQERNGNDVNGA
jgi:hypothetical protein